MLQIDVIEGDELKNAFKKNKNRKAQGLDVIYIINFNSELIKYGSSVPRLQFLHLINTFWRTNIRYQRNGSVPKSCPFSRAIF